MVLHLFGYKDRELLKIETSELLILVKGKPIHPTVEQLQLQRDEKGNWVKANLQIVSYNEPFKAYVFDPFNGDEKTGLSEYRPGQPVFPCFYEQQTYNIQIKGPEGKELQFYHENKNIREAVTSFSGILSGNINFKNDIGFSELQINSKYRPLLKIKIEVFPAKIDYQRDFQNLLREVNEEIYNLAYDFLRRTYLSASVTPNIKQSLGEFFNIINLIFNDFVKALERIKNNPYHKIVQLDYVNRIEKIKRFDYKSAKWICKHPEVLNPGSQPGGLNIDNRNYYPQKLRESKKEITYDTFENQFVKWVLKNVLDRLSKLHHEYVKLYENDNTRYDPDIDAKLKHMQIRLKKLSRLSFLKQVSDIYRLDNLSLVLQMAPGYRDLYRYYLILIKGLSIQSDVFHISIKDLSVLYEYWCFLSINKLLKRKYKLKKNNLIKANNRGLWVTLRKDKGADISYKNPSNGEIFTLSYQEKTPAPTITQIPDNVLSLRKVDSNVDYKYIFDAKYRINSAHDPRYYDKYGKPGPEEDDINTMHRYRDAMIYGMKDNNYERSVFGAFVLFPYANEDYYSGVNDDKPHNFYQSIQRVNIGGLPFLPGHTKLVEGLLDELIRDTPETALEKALLHKGTEHYYYNKFLKKNVLVGSLRNKKQFDLNIKHKFYHTPLRNVSNELGSLEYVALYQSKKLFYNQCGIYYYGKIKKYEIRSRDSIKEIPKSSKEQYVYFVIEEWLKLPNPIRPLNYGIYDRLFTTLPLLLSASEIPELSLKDDIEVRLWKELRRLVPDSKVQADNEILDNARIAEISGSYGRIRLEKEQLVFENDEHRKSWPREELRKNRIKVFKELMDFIKSFNGEKE